MNAPKYATQHQQHNRSCIFLFHAEASVVIQQCSNKNGWAQLCTYVCKASSCSLWCAWVCMWDYGCASEWMNDVLPDSKDIAFCTISHRQDICKQWKSFCVTESAKNKTAHPHFKVLKAVWVAGVKGYSGNKQSKIWHKVQKSFPFVCCEMKWTCALTYLHICNYVKMLFLHPRILFYFCIRNFMRSSFQ